jgi:hypothetical protein
VSLVADHGGDGLAQFLVVLLGSAGALAWALGLEQLAP